jgi:hypothetical protein
MYPFEGKSEGILSISIIKGKIKELSPKQQQKYSVKLKKILQSLLLQVCIVVKNGLICCWIGSR